MRSCAATMHSSTMNEQTVSISLRYSETLAVTDVGADSPKQTAFNRPIQDVGQFLGQCCHQLLVLLCLCELPVEWYLPNTPPDTIIQPKYLRSVIGGKQYLADRLEVHPLTI